MSSIEKEIEAVLLVVVVVDGVEEPVGRQEAILFFPPSL